MQQTKKTVALARLYWFTVEFGLMQPKTVFVFIWVVFYQAQASIYVYTVSRNQPNNVLDAAHPYRIDIMQPVYYTKLYP